MLLLVAAVCLSVLLVEPKVLTVHNLKIVKHLHKVFATVVEGGEVFPIPFKSHSPTPTGRGAVKPPPDLRAGPCSRRLWA